MRKPRFSTLLFGEGYNVTLILCDRLGKGFSLFYEMNIFEIIFFLSKFVPEKSN